MGATIRCPVELCIIFSLDECPFNLHGVDSLAIRPGVCCRKWDLIDELNRVLGTEDVNVSLEVEDMIVHRARKLIVDVESIVLVLGIEGTLDVPGRLDINTHGTISEEAVAEHVVIVANSINGTNDKFNVLCDSHVIWSGMAGQREVLISLKDANTAQVSVSCLGGVKAGVEIRCVCRAVITFDEFKSIRTKAVNTVEVCSVRLQRVAAGIVSHRFLKSELVENSISLKANVMQSHTSIIVEADVEVPAHPVDVVIFCVNGISCSFRS